MFGGGAFGELYFGLDAFDEAVEPSHDVYIPKNNVYTDVYTPQVKTYEDVYTPRNNDFGR